MEKQALKQFNQFIAKLKKTKHSKYNCTLSWFLSVNNTAFAGNPLCDYAFKTIAANTADYTILPSICSKCLVKEWRSDNLMYKGKCLTNTAYSDVTHAFNDNVSRAEMNKLLTKWRQEVNESVKANKPNKR